MLINRTITKKMLETIVHETFSKFGVLSSSSLLDSLKLLGFYYATNAGISINIEDLKTPKIKKNIIQTANEEINEISKLWQQGFVSDTERFQSIIDSWNIATDSLKNRIVDYYQLFDPANNLYIMAFSGARGNMSQVRQLVGMRGLMSDQEGKIIDLPIQANFREGLSSIDYIISSYGARKGIVDTALKTADSGYLTRRLIYIAQDLIIREIDCFTTTGIIILLKKNTNVKNIIGRKLIYAKSACYPYEKIELESTILNQEFLKELKNLSPLILNVRSSLTCNANGSICQKCYGWDLAQEKIISLGETVGIIAAQSIGEPGTQLTMRTFHTGGIFTSESLKQIKAPFSGKIIFPESLKTLSYRTSHGTNVLKLQQEAILTIINWQGLQKKIFLDIGSFLYLENSGFIKKEKLIAEYSNQSVIQGTRRLKPIYTSMAGEIRFENLLVRKMTRDERVVKINQENSVLWLASGKIFLFPIEMKYKFPKNLQKQKSFGNLKIITPFAGITLIKNNFFSILTKEKKISIDFLVLKQFFKNCLVKIFPIVRNYQYIDKFTVVSTIEIYPKYEGLIYSVRQKESTYFRTLFIITEADVWKINSDQINNFSVFQDKKTIVRSGNLLTNNSKFTRAGFFLKKDGFQMIFQNATPIFLSRGTILNYKQGDFVFEKKVFATLVNYTQQTEDIVQGLPKIEELIEARRPKVKSYLSFRPGVCLPFPFVSSLSEKELIKSSILKYVYKIESNELFSPNEIDETKKVKKTKIVIGHSLYNKEEIIIYQNSLFQVFPIPSFFEPEKVKLKSYYYFLDNGKQKGFVEEKEERQKKKECLLTQDEISLSKWHLVNVKQKKIDSSLYKFQKNKLIYWATEDHKSEKNVFLNLNGDYIVKTNEFDFVYLKSIETLTEYEIPLSSKLILNPGEFIDIGEPITEGVIDFHELLSIFFHYHLVLDGRIEGTIRSLYKFELLLVNSIQSIYQSQGVNISSKHIEIIVRQMTSKVVIKDSGDTPLLPGEIITLSLLLFIAQSLKTNLLTRTPRYEPLLISATTSSLSKDGFLSAAGFQETKRVLTRAALDGCSDWLRGLKECIIIGRLIPGGSSFLNYKNYLDNIYLFKT